MTKSAWPGVCFIFAAFAFFIFFSIPMVYRDNVWWLDPVGICGGVLTLIGGILLVRERKVLALIYILSAVALLFETSLPLTNRFRSGAQQSRSDQCLKTLTGTLLVYAEDHGGSVPSRWSALPRDYLQPPPNYYAVGGHVEIFSPKEWPERVPLFVDVFSHYSFIVTEDRNWLVVFERPGLWDHDSIGYTKVDLRDYSKPGTGSFPDRFHPKRTSQQGFANELTKLFNESKSVKH